MAVSWRSLCGSACKIATASQPSQITWPPFCRHTSAPTQPLTQFPPHVQLTRHHAAPDDDPLIYDGSPVDVHSAVLALLGSAQAQRAAACHGVVPRGLQVEAAA